MPTIGVEALRRPVAFKIVKVLKEANVIDCLANFQRRRPQLGFKIQPWPTETKTPMRLAGAIPIRTFADWDEQQPGFAEIDLVGHDGGVGYSRFSDCGRLWAK